MMIILVTANNFLLMFVGWEGVGVCSYLLVSFWFTRIAANQSSMSAFLTNRVGDCFLTIGMFAILWSFGNIDYSTVFSLAPFVNENIVTIIGICLLIGAMAKSSQVGLHVWLPMAMEGPTPVSALIHAATMVTAGVYLLMRSSPLIEYSSTVLILCLWLGAITTVFSSLIGLFQQDIKKVIAYSTMSQLGMMVIAVGLSSYNIALFHLVNHAFYKGLLFLGAGAVIHAVADNQDFRKYGGLRPFLPLTYSVMLIASLSLVAFPFMTGFYSKDFILESAYGQFYFNGTVVYFIATIAAMFTTLYSVKVLYLTFLTNPNGPVVNYKHAHEGDIFMSLPLIILAIFSIFFGYITKDIFIGLGSGFFSDNSIFIHPTHEIMLDTEFAVPTLFKLLPLFFTISLSIIAIVISEFIPRIVINFKLTRLGYNIFGFFNQRFLIEMFYNKYITGLILKLGGQTTKVLDKGSVEFLGPFGLEKGLITLSKNIASLDTGVITSYALYILIGLIFYITFIPYLTIFDNGILLLIILALFDCIFNHNYTVLGLKRYEVNKDSLGLKSYEVDKDSLGLNKYEVNKESLPLRSDIGLLIYFILTSKIFFRILLIFTIGWLIRFGINSIWTDNYLNSSELITSMYYLFMTCLATFTEIYNMLNNLPSMYQLYNSTHHGVRLFNFDQYIKAKIPMGDQNTKIPMGDTKTKIPTVIKPHIFNDDIPVEGGPSKSGPSKSKYVPIESKAYTGPKIAPSNAPDLKGLMDTENWRTQLTIYQEALTSLGKPDYTLTKFQLHCKNEVLSKNEYTEYQILHAMSMVQRNIDFAIKNPERVASEKLRLEILKSSEIHTPQYKLLMEKQALLRSIRDKLVILGEYNRKNCLSLGPNGLATVPGANKLTLDEMKSIVNIINNDPNASPYIKSKIKNGILTGAVGPNYPIVSYIEDYLKSNNNR